MPKGNGLSQESNHGGGEYQGWTNSATWCMAVLLFQEKSFMDWWLESASSGTVPGVDSLVDWATRHKLHTRMDDWNRETASRRINWQEISDECKWRYLDNDYTGYTGYTS